MIRVHESGGVSSIATLRVRESAGLSAIAYMRVREATGLSTIFTAGSTGTFDVTVIPQSPYGATASNFSTSVTTEVVTVTASGGVAPYTFLFAQVDGGDGWSISVVGSGQARFTRAGVGPGEDWPAEFSCSVTDAAGRKVDTPTITATVANYGRF